MVQKFDCVIIGAGLVGLATAYQIKKSYPHLSLAIVEKEAGPALHQSGHNSGVVHSGVYYKPGSLKAKNCIEGRKELLQFCDEQNIPYKILPKVIVATQKEELLSLQAIFTKGQANGVPGLEKIGQERLKEIEPYAVGLAALLVPQCAVISFLAVAQALCAWLQEQGCELLFNEKVQTAVPGLVETDKEQYGAKTIVNCAGLYSDTIAATTGLTAQIVPFRGEYYKLRDQAAHKVQGLIYPVPNPKFPFLGVHLTRMICGGVEAGPNAVLAFAREGYRKRDIRPKELLATLRYKGFWNMARQHWKVGCYEMFRSFSKKVFLNSLQQLVPSIQKNDLLSGGSGVRAQLVDPDGKLVDDFRIVEEKGIVHVLNAPSPAATGCLAIGRQVQQICHKYLQSG